MKLRAFLFLLFRHVLSVYQIPALGRTSDLSYFYDINQDKFYPVSALTDHFPNRAMLPIIKGNVECTSKVVKTMEQRLDSIGLDLRSKIDVMTGVIGASGAISYAKENQFDSECIYGVVHYKRLTMYESFHTRMSEIQTLLSLQPAKFLPATHVVLGIMWGVDIAISFEFKKKDVSSSTEATAELEMSLNKLAYSVEFGAKARGSNATSKSSSNIEIKIYGDLLIPNIPRNLDDVEELLRRVPEILEETSGKGSPQYFDVIEVNKLQMIINHDSLEREIRDSRPVRSEERHPSIVFIETTLLSVFEEKENTQKGLSLWQSRISKLEYMYDAKLINKFHKILSKFESIYTVYNAKFKKILHSSRAKVTFKSKKDFVRVKQKYIKHKYGPSNTRKLFDKIFAEAKTKYYDFQAFNSHGIKYLSKEQTVNQLRIENSNQTILCLFYTEQWKQANTKQWNVLSQWLVSQKGSRYVVDCNLPLHSEECKKEGTDSSLHGMRVERYDGANMKILTLDGASFYMLKENFSWKS